MVFLLPSCWQQSSTPSLQQSLIANRFLEIDQSTLLDPQALEGRRIVRPQGVVIPLLNAWIKEEATFSYCLFYRVPTDERAGKMYLEKHNDFTECHFGGGEIVLEYSPLWDLRVTQSEKDIRFQYRIDKGGNHTESFSFLLGGTLLLAKNWGDINEDEFLGGLASSYRSGRFEYCLQYDENCQDVITNECQRCRFGSYPVVSAKNCLTEKAQRICGPNDCGRRGAPACFRGMSFKKAEFSKNGVSCYEGSEAGFCHQGLRTYCDGEVLICL